MQLPSCTQMFPKAAQQVNPSAQSVGSTQGSALKQAISSTHSGLPKSSRSQQTSVPGQLSPGVQGVVEKHSLTVLQVPVDSQHERPPPQSESAVQATPPKQVLASVQ